MQINQKYLIIGVITIIALLIIERMLKFSSPTGSGEIRNDKMGAGDYNSSRGGGSRAHNGIDLLTTKGAPVYAPFTGLITRIAYPYGDDKRWKGCEIKGNFGYSMKLFYMECDKVLKYVREGEIIGYAQDVSEKHGGGMLAHIHVELRIGGVQVNPLPYMQNQLT